MSDSSNDGDPRDNGSSSDDSALLSNLTKPKNGLESHQEAKGASSSNDDERREQPVKHKQLPNKGKRKREGNTKEKACPKSKKRKPVVEVADSSDSESEAETSISNVNTAGPSTKDISPPAPQSAVAQVEKDESETSDTSMDPSPTSSPLKESNKPKSRHNSANLSKSKTEHTEKKKKRQSKEKGQKKEKEHPRIKRLRRCVIKAGMHCNYKQLLADCTKDKQRIAKIEQFLADRGFQGPYTLESAKQHFEEKEQKQELDALALNQIIGDRSQRVTTRARVQRHPATSQTNKPSKRVIAQFSDDDDVSEGAQDVDSSGEDSLVEEHKIRKAEIKHRLKGIVDSEED